ncbi:helix-turn-helix transcriptional regulator [Streptomyces sp. AC563]|uniref:helix-turn-helix domain-containing protein n=1 Tax=Streptomyces buecherae TaxID=2763006 RepID=UPI00164E6A55|nr:helix-turn-helix transcriptional regulator [Streptomyces buecherae]MBC3988023.1 helix-turn-helix transcriptional regulator [Streptomyces buecherae]
MSEDFDPRQYEAHIARERTRALSANQLVAYNLMRLRKANEWSQQDVAELLQKYTGRTWSNASVSAAERAWQGGRPRRFDASEILALARIFEEPIASFFLPPPSTYLGGDIGMREFPDDQPNRDPNDPGHDLMALVPVADVLKLALFHEVSRLFEFRMQELTLQHLGLIWMTPEWRPSMHIVGEQSMEKPEGLVDDYEVMKSEADAATEKLSASEKDAVFRVHAVEVAQEIIRLLDKNGIQLRQSDSNANRESQTDAPF